MTRYTEWKEYDDRGTFLKYICQKCGENEARMMYRRAYEEDSDHTEYQVVCPVCLQKSGVHWSKNLTAIEWNGTQDEISLSGKGKRRLTPDKHGHI